MIPYWFLFLIPAMGAIQRSRASLATWVMIGIGLTLMVGLRYRVGGDWFAYIRHMIMDGHREPIEIILHGREPAYRLLNWLAYHSVGEIWLVNLVCGAIFAAGLVSFLRRLPEPFLGLTVAIPYLVIVVSMGYTRQAAAIGLILFGLKYYMSDRVLRFMFCVMLAALFHRTAVLFAVLAIIPYVQRRLFMAALLLPVAYGLYVLVLAEHQERLIGAYIDSAYAQRSTGGLVRTALSGVFAAWFLLFRKRFAMKPLERLFWMWVALASIALVPIAVNYPTAADRIGLFLLPLQIVVASHIPSLFPRSQAQLFRVMIVLFFALVMFVWLFFADNRDAWLPYAFWPLA